jgi:hypothetical protein
MLLSTAVAFAGTAAFAESRSLNEDGSGTWNVMVYMCGDNNLEPYAISDLKEMEKVGSQNGVTIIALMDTLTLIDEKAHWYLIEKGSDHVGAEPDDHTCDCHLFGEKTCPGELDMGDGKNLTMFIIDAVEYAPADHYMLVLWDHGGGWRGVCWDDTTVINEMGWFSRLTTPETAEAIEAAQTELAGGEIDPDFKLTIIGYDACLNGMIEVAYENRDIADYMFASINLVPVDGMAYDLFLAEMVKSSRTTIGIGEAIVDSYVEYYSDWNSPTGQGLEYFGDVTLSFFKLGNEITELVSSVDALAGKLIQGGYLDDNSYRGAIASAESQTPRIPTYSGEQIPFIDLGLYASLLGQKIPDLQDDFTDAVVAGVNKVVLYENHIQTPGGAVLRTSGISIMFTWSWEYLNPAYQYETYEEADASGNPLYYGLAFVIDTWWDEFVFTYSQAYDDSLIT